MMMMGEWIMTTSNKQFLAFYLLFFNIVFHYSYLFKNLDRF